MAFDAARAETVRNPAVSPALQSQCSMTYDTTRGRIVLYGGSTGSGSASELWEWDGTNWTQSAAPLLSPRRSAAIAYDSARARLVLFGGQISSPISYIAETWEYGALDRAASADVGTACAGPIVPKLTTFGLPTLGNGSFGLDLVHGAANASALFGVAAGDASLPLGPCTVHLTVPIIGIPIATNGVGFAHLNVPLPLIAAYSGIDLFSQGFVLDASAPLGVALTAGLRWTLGE